MPTLHPDNPSIIKDMLNRSGSATLPPSQDLSQESKPDQVSAEEEEEEEEEEEPEEDLTNQPPVQAQDDEESGFDDQILNSLVPPEDDAAESAINRSGEMAPADNGPVYDSDSSASGTDSLTWISWFCSLAGHEYFAEVAEDFIEDDFNLTGLMAMVPFYKEALEMILDVEAEDDTVKVPDVSIVESSAELLYGLIHQRYIVTRQGLAQMNAKYENAHFGYCPRVFCQTSKVVPCGKSDLPGDDTVVLYCPNCLDIYHPPSSRFNGIDGAFFGTTFPHLLFQTYREIPPILLPSSTSSSQPSSSDPPCDLQSKSSIMSESLATEPPTSSSKIYGPRIYGFRVSERARSGPRMQWLRLRPRDEEELHRGLKYHERDTSQPPEQT